MIALDCSILFVIAKVMEKTYFRKHSVKGIQGTHQSQSYKHINYKSMAHLQLQHHAAV